MLLNSFMMEILIKEQDLRIASEFAGKKPYYKTAGTREIQIRTFRNRLGDTLIRLGWRIKTGKGFRGRAALQF